MEANDMHADRTGLLRSCHITAALLCCCLLFLCVPHAAAGTVTCDETTISVSASDMKAEDLMKEIGTACGIRIVLRGEVFTESFFSVQFESMPLRSGLERVLRTVNIPNHTLHFSGGADSRRVVEIHLIGQKGGERELTPGTPPPAPKAQAQKAPPEPQPEAQAEQGPAQKTGLDQQQDEKLQEKFVELLDKVLDEQFENEENIDPQRVLEAYRQALPEDMRDNIPEEVMEELEMMADD